MRSAERWFAMAGVAVLSLVAVAGLALAIYAAWLFHDLPDAGQLAEYRPATATRVYAWDGTLIGEFSRERRIFVPYDEIPAPVVHAFLAAEDRNFFEHGGIDVSGLGRAMAKNVLNAMRGRRLEGGSTITQQVAKNVLLNNDPTLGRKLKEAILARRLEATLTKEQILELYLNEIFLGYRSYGVASAAYNYFGKPLNQLTLAQAAYLAALPKGPNNYQPVKRKAFAIARRNWILDQMHKAGWITADEERTAQAEDLVVQVAPKRAQYQDADFFVAEARRRSLDLFGDKVDEGGYYMRTTLDPRLQTLARDALMHGLERYDRRHGWRGAWGNVPVDENWRKAAAATVTPAERRAWRAAIVTSASEAKVELVDGRTGRLDSSDVAWARGGKGLKTGDLIFVEPESSGLFNLRQVPAVNGALVVVDPLSGRVLAMVGGYSFSVSNFNRATQAYRQPGSAFKPFVYATALQGDFTPASTVLDAPITLVGANGQVWQPENYEKGRYYGPSTLRRGLELSRNVMTVRLAQKVGMSKISANAVKFGVVDQMAPVLAMALGAGETTPLRLTTAYSIFVNGGRKVTPHLIEMVEDRDGKPIYTADPRACPGCDAGFSGEDSPRLDPQGQPVLDPITAYQINSMLQGVVQHGTAVSARVLGRPIGGKTGTTNEYRSAWFVGFTPSMVAGVFVGFDDNRSLGEGEAGAVAAVPIFIDFMQQALKGKPIEQFAKPKGAKYLMVHGQEEAFRPGTEPKVIPKIGSELTGPGGEGPKPYDELWKNGTAPEGPVGAPPSHDGPPPLAY